MYQKEKIKLSDNEKKQLIDFINNESLQFCVFNSITYGTTINFSSKDKTHLNIKFPLGDKLKGDNSSKGNLFLLFKVDSSVVHNLKAGDYPIDKGILLERFGNMIEGGLKIEISEIIKNSQIKFYIRKDDDFLKDRKDYVVRIAHESNGKIKFWSICSTYSNKDDNEEYKEKVKVLNCFDYPGRKFEVIDYLFGDSEMNIIKNSELSKELKNKIEKNEFTKIDNKEFIDVTDEVIRIIVHEFNSSKELTNKEKIAQDLKDKKMMEEIREHGEAIEKQLKEDVERQRTEKQEAKNLKFNLNLFQRIVGMIVDFFLKLIGARKEENKKYDLLKINTIEDLKILKSESKTWSSQIKFDKCVDQFIKIN